MYANYFGFREVPFRQLTEPCHLYMSEGFEAVRMEVLEAVRDKARVVLLTGHPGAGKTKLLQHLHAALESTAPVFYLTAPAPAHQLEEFVANVAAALEIELPSDGDVFEPFQEALRSRSDGVSKPLLLIDDADSLGCDVLENLIELFQLGTGEESLAQLVLAAHPEFEYTLERPELRELEENLARLSRLRPLDTEDVGRYIGFALGIIGYDADPVFTPEAVEAIAAHSRGVPQLINSLCGAALMAAYGRDENPVSVDTIEAAVEDVAGIAVGDGETGEGALYDELEDPAEMGAAILTRRTRRWPLAAVGVGGALALTAVLVLFGTLPSEDDGTNAESGSGFAEARALTNRVSELDAEVQMARAERERLEAELTETVAERDHFASQLALLEAQRDRLGQEAAKREAAGSQTAPESETIAPRKRETADDLLAQLMASADELSQPGVYVVQKGDTLWGIAQMHAMTLEALKEANGLGNTGGVKEGQRLTVGAEAGASPAPQIQVAVAELAEPSNWYVVEPGDSLYGIGRKFSSSVEDLLRWNQLANANQLRVGQKLRLIPAETIQ